MADQTIVQIDFTDGDPDTVNGFKYLPDLVVAARAAAGQIALPQMTGLKIVYYAAKGNSEEIIFTTDPHAGLIGRNLYAEESSEDSNWTSAEMSLRNWYVKTTALGKAVPNLLIISMQY